MKLVESGADIHAEQDQALLEACCSAGLDIVKFLVEKGADINYVDKKGKTIWEYVKKDASLEVIKYLKSKYPELR